ncbi:MAG: response regulator, partial [Propionibacteriaceae bacterium]|nr:response regulator [Propionibacteriaceae bacterium]
MQDVQLTVLLIEDNPGDARLIQEALSDLTDMSLSIVLADRLSHGVDRLAAGDVDLVLLDLSLPDSDWQETLKAVHRRSPFVPIIVLTGIEDELVANQAVEEGAQDFLIKGEVDARSLERAIRYAIQRHRTVTALRAMSM